METKQRTTRATQVKFGIDKYHKLACKTLFLRHKVQAQGRSNAVALHLAI